MTAPGTDRSRGRTVLLFDGKCNLCNGAVQFVIDHERSPSRNGEAESAAPPATKALAFASLQSEVARELLRDAVGEDAATRLREGANGSGDPDSLVLIEDGEAFTHSSAALRVARHLRAPWSFATVFLVVPRFLRDAVYRFIAKRRYGWFGKTESCRVPTPELRARFLDPPPPRRLPAA